MFGWMAFQQQINTVKRHDQMMSKLPRLSGDQVHPVCMTVNRDPIRFVVFLLREFCWERHHQLARSRRRRRRHRSRKHSNCAPLAPNKSMRLLVISLRPKSRG
jgi:hypothetical protein